MITSRRTKSGDQRYDVRYRGPDRKVRNKTFRTKKEAERFEREMLTARDRGTWIDPSGGRTTLSNWAAEWERTNVHLRTKSTSNYAANLRLHILPELGEYELSRLNGAVLRSWMADLTTKQKMTKKGGPISASYSHQVYRTLNRLLHAAVEAEKIARNPLDGVKPPSIERGEMRFLTADQVAALAAAIDSRYRAFVLVAAYCGLREGELRALRRRHVNPLLKTITVVQQLDERRGGGWDVWDPKTEESRRSVPIPKFLAEELEAHLAQWSDPGRDGLVFTAPQGGPVRIENWRRRVWTPAFTKTGIEPLRLHDLRHTCASLAIAAGADIKVLQRMLGHKRASTTLDLYGHLMPGQMEAVADRLDAIARAAKPHPRSEHVQARDAGADQSHLVRAANPDSG